MYYISLFHILYVYNHSIRIQCLQLQNSKFKYFDRKKNLKQLNSDFDYDLLIKHQSQHYNHTWEILTNTFELHEFLAHKDEGKELFYYTMLDPIYNCATDSFANLPHLQYPI